MRLFKYLYIALVIVFMAMQIVTFPLQPQTVASHFNVHMMPDGYLPKLQYFLSIVTTFLLVNVCTIAVIFVLPFVPSYWINTPKKEFWMRPENKPVFIAVMKGRLYGFMAVINAMFTIMAYLVFKANQSRPVVLSGSIHWCIIIALAVMFIGAVQLIVRLNRVNQNSGGCKCAG